MEDPLDEELAEVTVYTYSVLRWVERRDVAEFLCRKMWLVNGGPAGEP